MIATPLARDLGLAPVGKVKVNHAGGAGESLTYLVNFTLPNRVRIVGLIVTEFPEGVGPGVGAIIGMDVITLGDFSITNVEGKTCMSFRTPSCAPIDYVAEFNQLRFAGVGRNDPCPCGKEKAPGKRIKFKHCHGA